jgi:hypothetical protein
MKALGAPYDNKWRVTVWAQPHHQAFHCFCFWFRSNSPPPTASLSASGRPPPSSPTCSWAAPPLPHRTASPLSIYPLPNLTPTQQCHYCPPPPPGNAEALLPQHHAALRHGHPVVPRRATHPAAVTGPAHSQEQTGSAGRGSHTHSKELEINERLVLAI